MSASQVKAQPLDAALRTASDPVVDRGGGPGRTARLSSGEVIVGTGPQSQALSVDGSDAVPYDVRMIQTIDRVRVLLACAVAAGISLSRIHDTPQGIRAILLAGLVWVPWSCFLAISSRPTERRRRLLATAGDGLVLLVAGWLAPTAIPLSILVGLLVVGVTTYLDGRNRGLITAGFLLTGWTVLFFRDGAGSPGEGAQLVAAGPTLLCICVMLDWIVRTQRRQAAHAGQAENKAETILGHVADAVLLTDPMGVVSQWNAACGRTLGLVEDEVVGGRCEQLLGLHFGERRLDCRRGCALLGLLEGDATEVGVELWRHHGDGRRQPLLANASALRDDEGHLIEVVHSIRDITALKQADEAKTLFLATASHELKTPLTVIRGFAQTLLLAPNMDDEDRTAALKAIQRRAIELSRIVDRLLLSSRIEAGRVSLLTAPTDLVPILSERVSSLSGASGRLIDLALPADLPLAQADEDAFTTVLDHLLDNAVKYSPGGERIEVRAGFSGAGLDERIWVSVRDEGIGMSSEQAERAFDKFWQAESSDVRRFGGTGIGLYIVHSLVEAMDGDLSVKSAPARGATFRFELRSAASATARDAIEAARPAWETGAGDTSSEQMGEPSMIRELMRQIGVPTGGGGG